MTGPGALLVKLGEAAVARPRRAVALWLIVAALMGLAAARIRPTGSIDAVLTEGPASEALGRVVREFGVVDNLILLATVTPAETDPHGRLLRFARQFEQAVRGSPALDAQCAEIACGPMPEMVAFVRERVAPSALWLVDDATLDAVLARLTPEEMRAQIRRGEELMAAPAAGGAIARAIVRDPLRLYEVLMPAFAGRLPAVSPLDREPLTLSRDGRTLMMRVVGTRPASDLDFARTFTADLTALAQREAGDDLTIEATGAYAIATTAERAIRADLVGTITGSVGLLLILFLLVYRRPARFLMAMAPVGVGMAAAFGLGSFFFPGLTPAAGAIGAVLAGLSIDYSIHYLSHFASDLQATASPPRAAGLALAHVAPAMAMACATSLIGFLAIGQSSVPALRQFAWLGLFGLAGAMLATITLLPALLTLSARRAAEAKPDCPPRQLMLPLARRVTVRPVRWAAPLLLVVVIGGAGALLAPGPFMPLEHDLTVMHPRPNPPLDLQHALPERFGFDPDSLLVHLSAPNETGLLRTAHRVDRALRGEAARAVGVVGALGPAAVLPDPDAAEARAARLRSIDAEAIVRGFEAALAESVFEPAAFAAYGEFLRRLLAAPSPPDWADLRRYPSVAGLILPRQEIAGTGEVREALVVIFSDQARTQRAQRDAAIEAIRGLLAPIDGAVLTGISVVGYDTEHRVRGDLARLLGVALALVLVALLVYFRSLAATVLALVPCVFGLICLAELADVLGLRLNMVNLIGAPILIGMGVDAGIFLVSLAEAVRRQRASAVALADRLATGCEAVCLSTLTTVLSFGTLSLASTPAIRSLGAMLALAMLATLAGSVMLLVPMLVLRHRRLTGSD